MISVVYMFDIKDFQQSCFSVLEATGAITDLPC